MGGAEKQDGIPVDEAVVTRTPTPTPLAELQDAPEVPYSIYTRREKWLIVAMVALAGFYR